ncbi:MAG: carboxypeptidase regulatory-like domain-containing protein [Microcoleaceae cyanobacterium]
MRWILIIPLFVGSSLVGIETANAHGALIDYQITETIEIQSRYDTGEPLAKAQVTVYTPDNPNTPWQTGITDEDGKFIFTPNADITGYWEVKVRQAGHGGLVSIPVETTTPINKTNSSQNATGLNPWQRGLMIGSVIWGCIGTALFFMKNNPSTVEASSQSQS